MYHWHFPCKYFVRTNIFYLDNMDYGPLSHPHISQPRMKEFNQDKIGRLVMADTVGLTGVKPKRVFGAGKLLPDSEVPYRRRPTFEKHLPEPISLEPISKANYRKPIVTGSNSTRTNMDGIKGDVINDEQLIQIAANLHKAKCFKILTAAKKVIEEETSRLIGTVMQINRKRPKEIVEDCTSNAKSARTSPCSQDQLNGVSPKTPDQPAPIARGPPKDQLAGPHCREIKPQLSHGTK